MSALSKNRLDGKDYYLHEDYRRLSGIQPIQVPL